MKYEQLDDKIISRSNGSAIQTYLPTNPHDQDYDFKCLSRESPPISQKLFFLHCYSCQVHCRRPRWIHKCTAKREPEADLENVPDTCSQNTAKLMELVPKRFEEWVQPSSGYEVAFGMTAFELPRFFGFVVYSCLCFAGPAVFWGLWLLVMSHEADMQNAAVPALFGATLWVVFYQSTSRKMWCRNIEY
jgi:hypothetical protein